MQLLAGIDAPQILSRTPVVPAGLTQSLLFALRDVDGAVLRLADNANNASGFNRFQLLLDRHVRPGLRVLEVGAGSGYVTALLSLLAAEVYSVERHAQLAALAESTLHRLNYRNVRIRVGDGSQGWAEFARFDAILVSAATAEMPPALFDQLREGGRMMVPIGPSSSQELQLISKVGGRPEVKTLEGCRFVPLVEGAVESG